MRAPSFGGHYSKDKKRREKALEKLESLVIKNYEKFFIPCFSGGAHVDRRRNFRGIKLMAPHNTPLERVLFRPEIRIPLERAMEDTLLMSLELWEEEDGEDLSDDENDKNAPEEMEFTKPDIPIFEIDACSMSRFFKQFLRDLYKYDGTKSIECTQNIKMMK